MRKEFLSYDTVRNNALKMAYKIYKDGFIPDVIYVALRGGAYLGHSISEYFKLIRMEDHPTYYAAVVAHSYKGTGIDEQIRVDGWTYSPEYLRTGDKVLLVDDIFDTGRTINFLSNIILEHGIPRKDLKVVVHDYKYFYDKPDTQPVKPDYWCRRLDASINDEPLWIHYMSHELLGLTRDELEKYYYSQDPELREALKMLELQSN